MLIVLILTSYLIGSIPVAWLITKLVTGQDLRQMGSGNVGVMNTMLNVARWAGLLVFLAEGAKGVLAVTLARTFGGEEVRVGLAVLAVIAGTRWSVWLRGAGGRGNTAGMAALLVISWPTLLGALGMWFLTRLLTGSSFVAMRVTLALWPFLFGLITRSWWAVILGVVFSLLFVSTHRTETDDHLRLKKQWASLGEFLTAARRK
jgi:glycerol-3-phosphate acyltransferase PlsY